MAGIGWRSQLHCNHNCHNSFIFSKWLHCFAISKSPAQITFFSRKTPSTDESDVGRCLAELASNRNMQVFASIYLYIYISIYHDSLKSHNSWLVSICSLSGCTSGCKVSKKTALKLAIWMEDFQAILRDFRK